MRRCCSCRWDRYTWNYTLSFTPQLPAGSTAYLVFDGSLHRLCVLCEYSITVSSICAGVKMAASVTLNGAPVGDTIDQFLRYTFDVSTLLKARCRDLAHPYIVKPFTFAAQ